MKLKSELTFSLVAGILVMLFSMVLLSNQKISIIEGGDFNDPDFWLCRGNSTIKNGAAHLMVNETRGKNCFFSSVQQGKYPHGWDKKDSVNEIEVRRNLEAAEGVIFLRISANRSEFEFYNETESIVNIGVMIWIQLDDNYDKPINESRQLELDINIASFLYGWWTNYTVKPITWDTHFVGHVTGEDNDYHYVDSSNNVMMEANRMYEVHIDVGKSIAKAFDCFNIQSGKIKSFDIYIEAKYGYGEVDIEHAEFVFAPKINSRYVIYQSSFNGLLAFLISSAAFLVLHLLRKIENKMKPKH